MARSRAFYSVVQYCPDAGRSESVNVGLVLLRPEPYLLMVRMTDNLSRAKRWFQLSDGDVISLKMSVTSMENRIRSHDPRTEDELTHFTTVLGNAIKMTKPRLAIVDDAKADFERMFTELVEDT